MKRSSGGWWLVVLTVLAAGGPVRAQPSEQEPPTRAHDARVDWQVDRCLRRGVAWLVRQQAPDGGWYSQTYGQMRSGAANTALAVWALTQAANLERDAHAARELGLAFLLGNLDPRGFVRAPDDSCDYPAYATALTLLAIERSGGEHPARPRLRAYLRNELVDTARGDRQATRRQGAWNLSVMRFTVEALRQTGGLDIESRRAALAYLFACQNVDGDDAQRGGFCFVPEATDQLNKAGWLDRPGQPRRGRSYGTTTADGLCALAALELAPSDRAQAALGWLERQALVAAVPGFANDAEGRITSRALMYYYRAALAQVLRYYPDYKLAEGRSELIAWLSDRQRADGSWRNDCGLMKEDDPLIATCLAIVALAAARDGAIEPGS